MEQKRGNERNEGLAAHLCALSAVRLHTCTLGGAPIVAERKGKVGGAARLLQQLRATWHSHGISGLFSRHFCISVKSRLLVLQKLAAAQVAQGWGHTRYLPDLLCLTIPLVPPSPSTSAILLFNLTGN